MAKNRTRKRKPVFSAKDYDSSDGMLTSVWGPSLWHFLHTMSFNYPVHPTSEQKKHYKEFILSLRHILPCRHCRENLDKNFKYLPLKACDLRGREEFSRYVYNLHEAVNKLLGKKSGLSYADVRDRYENFRSRCTSSTPKLFTKKSLKKTAKKEKGCTVPLYGKKAKSIIKIVPQGKTGNTIQIDDQCLKRRVE